MAVEVPTVEDVARILGIAEPSESQEAAIQAAIESAAAWAKKYLKYDYEDLAEDGVETFYEINEDGTIPTPVDGATISEVRVFRSAGDEGQVLDPDVWQANPSHIILRPSNVLTPFEGATSRRMFGTYSKIQVTFDASEAGEVPPAIRDGVALAAAAFWTRSSRIARGIQSETIGDYSYSLSGGGAVQQHPMFGEAKALLRSFRRPSILV